MQTFCQRFGLDITRGLHGINGGGGLGASSGRSAELDVPAIDISSHRSSSSWGGGGGRGAGGVNRKPTGGRHHCEGKTILTPPTVTCRPLRGPLSDEGCGAFLFLGHDHAVPCPGQSATRCPATGCRPPRRHLFARARP